MTKVLLLTSPYPNLHGRFVEKACSGGRPAFARESSRSDPAVAWIFHSAKFGRGPCWYVGRSLPDGGSLSSFCASVDDADTPENARWPADDVTSIVAEDVDMTETENGFAGGTAAFRSTVCSACKDLEQLCASLLCCACAASEDSSAMCALSLLQNGCSSSTRQKLAVAFVSGDAGTRRTLETIAAAQKSTDQMQRRTPIVLAEPPPSITVGKGTTSLICEAFSVENPEALRFQWYKNGIPVLRAIRARYVLSGAVSSDAGSYFCDVSASGSAGVAADTVACLTTTSRACDVTLQAAEVEQRADFEVPLEQAKEAEGRGDFLAAVGFLAEAIRLVPEANEGTRAEALCRRALLLLRLERWQEAFRESTDSLKLSPGLSRAHAARGTAAVKLGKLAEAASSWETAELLGGVPEAAREAELCRERLQTFFAERQAKRGEAGSAGAGRHDSNCNDADAEGDNKAEDWEDSWKRSGFHGRYAGGSAGSFFGGRGGGAGGAGGRGTRSSSGGYQQQSGSSLSPELQRHLKVLGLSAAPKGQVPTAEAVRGAYRKLALQMHPDKPGGSKTAFQELQNAYEAVLSAAAS